MLQGSYHLKSSGLRPHQQKTTTLFVEEECRHNWNYQGKMFLLSVLRLCPVPGSFRSSEFPGRKWRSASMNRRRTTVRTRRTSKEPREFELLWDVSLVSSAVLTCWWGGGGVTQLRKSSAGCRLVAILVWNKETFDFLLMCRNRFFVSWQKPRQTFWTLNIVSFWPFLHLDGTASVQSSAEIDKD